MDWNLGVKPWSGVLSGIWSGMESDLEFYQPSRTGFYDRPTGSDGVEWGQILEGTTRLKLKARPYFVIYQNVNIHSTGVSDHFFSYWI